MAAISYQSAEVMFDGWVHFIFHKLWMPIRLAYLAKKAVTTQYNMRLFQNTILNYM